MCEHVLIAFGVTSDKELCKRPARYLKDRQKGQPTFESRRRHVNGLQTFLAGCGDGGDDDAVVLARFKSGEDELHLGREVAGYPGRVDAHLIRTAEKGCI